MNELPKVYAALGVIDSYGAIHFRLIRDGEALSEFYHDTLWPNINCRWRFNVRDWEIRVMPGAPRLSFEDEDLIDRTMRKHVIVPQWVRWNDAWEAAGRPRQDDKAYDRALKKFNAAELKAGRPARE